MTSQGQFAYESFTEHPVAVGAVVPAFKDFLSHAGLGLDKVHWQPSAGGRVIYLRAYGINGHT